MMDDDTIRAKAKAAKLPKIMWDTVGFRERLAVFVESEVAAERERCALVAESWADYHVSVTSIGPRIAAQIRAAIEKACA
jgi:hypothetical protein